MAAYIDFTKSPDYPRFMQGMGEVLASPPQLYHFFPNSFPPHIPLSTAPYTEVTTFCNTIYSPDFRQNVESFVKVLDEGKVEGYLGAVYGDTEVIGKRVINSGSAEVKKASMMVMCVGVCTPFSLFKSLSRISPLFFPGSTLPRFRGAGVAILASFP